MLVRQDLISKWSVMVFISDGCGLKITNLYCLNYTITKSNVIDINKVIVREQPFYLPEKRKRGVCCFLINWPNKKITVKLIYL